MNEETKKAYFLAMAAWIQAAPFDFKRNDNVAPSLCLWLAGVGFTDGNSTIFFEEEFYEYLYSREWATREDAMTALPVLYGEYQRMMCMDRRVG